MKLNQICILFAGLISMAAPTTRISLSKDFFNKYKSRSMIELGKDHGYLIEEHKITTADGYILSTYRIPPGKQCGYRTVKKPVLLLHGVLSSSYDFISGGPKKSLAYKLANKCYDVWLKNSRGNSVSREHVNLTTSDPEFWNYSWHEMGVYDIPATIDHILNVTNQTSCHYVGHSQGTTEFLVFSSLLPEYHNKIVSAQLLAPVAYFKYMNNPPIYIAAQLSDLFELILRSVNIYDSELFCGMVRNIGYHYCRDDKYPEFSDFCAAVIFTLAGVDESQINMTGIYQFMENSPSGAALKQLYHYAQSIRNNKFSQYDYGAEKNLELYGSTVPPEYNISSINIPMVVYYSDNDIFVSVKEIENLIKMLPSLVEVYRIPFEKFNHYDYLIAIDADILLWNKVVDVIDKFE